MQSCAFDNTYMDENCCYALGTLLLKTMQYETTARESMRMQEDLPRYLEGSDSSLDVS